MLKHNLLKIYLVLGVGLLVVMLGLPSVPVARALGNPITITVNTLDDVVDPSDDQCSLREAIVAANTNRRSGPPILREECTAGQNWSWGVDQIFFSVSGIIVVDPYSILGPLPDLYEGKTHIDGWSGMGPGTLPVVTLDGSQLDSGGNGLTLTSLANEVRGLAIINFINGSGISISGQYGNVNMVYGNWIGVDTQSNAQPNKIGVTIDSGTQYNRIEENVISGNTKAGVKIGGTFNMVTGQGCSVL